MHPSTQPHMHKKHFSLATKVVSVAILIAAVIGVAIHGRVHAGSPTTTTSDGPNWVGTWGASPIEPLGPANTLGTPASFADQTLRMVVNPHLAGPSVRIRLSNQFGEQPVTFTSVFIGEGVGGGSPAIVPGTNTQLMFGGNASVTIGQGHRAYSDEAPFTVEPFRDLVISFYTAGATGPATQHTNAQQTSYVAAGDQGSDTTGAVYQPNGETWYFLTDVDVHRDRNAGSVLVLGDSITDGLQSTPNTNHRYPDFLAARLQASADLSCLSVVNEGIAGDRVLFDNIGPDALDRTINDAVSQPAVRDIILEDGINDLADPVFLDPTETQEVTAQQVFDGLVDIANRAHAKQIKVFATTLTPSGDAAQPARPPFQKYSTPPVVTKRDELNALIRSHAYLFDGVFDFEAAVANPANPNEFNPAFVGFDGLHPNDSGYNQLANAVDLAQLGPCDGPPGAGQGGSGHGPDGNNQGNNNGDVENNDGDDVQP